MAVHDATNIVPTF